MKYRFMTLLLALTSLLSSCRAYDEADYLSEARYRIWTGSAGDYTVSISASRRETPYLSDGYVDTLSDVLDVTVMTEKRGTLSLSFTIGEKTYSGEAIFDAAKNVYTYSCGAVPSAVPISVEIGDTVVTAKPVNEEDRTKEIVHALASQQEELFSSLKNGKTFEGEIYVRLIYDEVCYYYVGVVDRNGNTYSFLTDESGKILAQRQ